MEQNQPTKKDFPTHVYGLGGLMELLKISRTSAWRKKRDELAGTYAQSGRTIVWNTKSVLERLGMERRTE